VNIKRLLKHLLTPDWMARRAFPPHVLASIERAIAQSESGHEGELRFAVEAGLALTALLRGASARERAIEAFSALRVWDTAHDSGVLIYVQLVDRKMEIVADRGISARVGQEQWGAICRKMEHSFRAGDFTGGALAAIAEINTLLCRHFPAHGANPNELPDRPVIL
jgi:uncharacterized membrane protein